MGPNFNQVIDVGYHDPGPEGEQLRVRYHGPSGHVGLIRRTPLAITYAVIGDVLHLAFVIIMVAFTAWLGFALVKGGLGLLR